MSSDQNDDGPREVTVPLRTYKAITVFSTLLAIGFVIFGFAVLDAATAGVGVLSVVFDFVGVSGDAFTLVGALVGLAFIGLGAGIYVLGTRFRTEGMGKAQEDGDELSDNE